MSIAKEGVLPATEGESSNWNWDWNVHTNHAYFNVELELACGVAIAGVDRGGVGKIIVVDQLNSGAVAINANACAD